MRLVYFTADWCQPCRKFGPLLTAEAAARGLPVERVDIDTRTDAARAYSVMSVPTVVVLSSAGQMVDRFGSMPAYDLRARLDAVKEGHL